jgi:hypothetical protein
MFAYCGNNPIGRSDESGLLPTFSILVPDTYQRRVVAEDSEEYYETVSGHLKKNGQKINLPFNTTRVTVTKEETTVCKASDEIKEVTWYVRMTVKQQVYECAKSLPPEYGESLIMAFSVANYAIVGLQRLLPNRPAGKYDTYKIYAYHNEEHENHMYNNTIVTERVPVVTVTTYHISQETGTVYYGGSTVLSLGIPG